MRSVIYLTTLYKHTRIGDKSKQPTNQPHLVLSDDVAPICRHLENMKPSWWRLRRLNIMIILTKIIVMRSNIHIKYELKKLLIQNVSLGFSFTYPEAPPQQQFMHYFKITVISYDT